MTPKEQEKITIHEDYIHSCFVGRLKTCCTTYGYKKAYKVREKGMCPHCNSDNLQEIKINGEPDNTSWGTEKAGIFYDHKNGMGTKMIRGKITTFPITVNTKFLCLDCNNEHTLPERNEYHRRVERENDREKQECKKLVYMELKKHKHVCSCRKKKVHNIPMATINPELTITHYA